MPADHTRRRFLLFAVVALLGVAAGAWTASLLRDRDVAQASADAQGLIGQRRPPWTLGAADGRRVSADEFDGDVVLVNFWATWCAPCRREMPALVDFHNQYGLQGLSIVGVALDDVQQARDFADDLGVNYTVVVGGADVMAMGVVYGNQAGMLPYTVLIDRQGVIQWTHLGEWDRDSLESRILGLLSRP